MKDKGFLYLTSLPRSTSLRGKQITLLLNLLQSSGHAPQFGFVTTSNSSKLRIHVSKKTEKILPRFSAEIVGVTRPFGGLDSHSAEGGEAVQAAGSAGDSYLR